MWKDKDGHFSQAKFWSTIAYGISTFVVAKTAISGQVSDTMFIVFLAIVGGADVAKKWITMHYGSK